ncbi:MAG TPA: hypothetical protein VFU47_08395, partial [Armatimonadota bacterium]|nr:hypothetical protein [Armatimonadota bacterium]
MQRREPVSPAVVERWVALTLAAVFVLAPALRLLRLLLTAAWWGACASIYRARRLPRLCRDACSREERASRRRLQKLYREDSSIQHTLRELRELTLTREEALRAAWAEGELRESLLLLRRAIGRERAVLYSLWTARRAAQLDHLLRRPPKRRALALRLWLEELNHLRAETRALHYRLTGDRDALSCSLGESTEEV